MTNYATTKAFLDLREHFTQIIKILNSQPGTGKKYHRTPDHMFGGDGRFIGNVSVAGEFIEAYHIHAVVYLNAEDNGKHPIEPYRSIFRHSVIIMGGDVQTACDEITNRLHAQAMIMYFNKLAEFDPLV